MLHLGIAVVAVLVVVVGGVVVLAGDDSDGASGCVPDLVGHLPADTDVLYASDLAAAREAGYDDTDLDALKESSIETGIMPDPVTRRVLAATFDIEDAPYAPADVRCWVGGNVGYVARGSFDDEQRMDDSDIELTVAGDLVTDSPSDPDLRAPGEPPAGLELVAGALADQGALTFAATQLTDPEQPVTRWSGMGLASGDDWDLVLAWGFPDDGAEAGEAAVRDALSSPRSTLDNLVDGDPTEALERSGPVVTLRAPLAGEPTDWTEALWRFDPALTLDVDD